MKNGHWIRILIFLILSFSLPARAQEKESAPRTKGKSKPASRSVLQLRYGVGLWQETITLKAGASESKMVAQSMGVMFDIGRSRRVGRSAWNFVYGADLGIGTLKGKGNNDNVPDELENQYWIIAGFTSGMMFRTSPVSELGLLIPIYYRQINWQLASGSNLDIEEERATIGVSGAFITHLNKTAALHLTITQQYQWNATMWGLSYQHTFL